MAKKKKKKASSGAKAKRKTSSRMTLPDPRTMARMMQQFMESLQNQAAGVSPEESDEPVSELDALLDRAYDEPDERRRIQLAEEALRLSPDCADAHLLLAESASNPKQAAALFQQAMDAAERTLGPNVFTEHVGRFWGILETRPYMRARQGLTEALWAMGRRDEAVGHLREMLRLNPGDNQGVRYTLAGYLLLLDLDDDLAKLLEQYSDEGSASWAYTKALLAFRRTGDSAEAKRLLKAAAKTNSFVPAFLMGIELPPAGSPDYISPGDESEAVDYVNGFLAGWKATLGAVAWVRANLLKPTPGPRGKGPNATVEKRLIKLRLEHDVWQADVRQLPAWITIGGMPVRPWTILTTSRSQDKVLNHAILDEPPSAALVWDSVVQAMQKPAAGKPHLPSVIRILPHERWEELRPHFTKLGIELEVAAELDLLDAAFAALSEQVCGRLPPALLEMPGMTPELVGAFFAAAASFFREAPWKRTGYESAVKIECDKFQSGPWYAVLMGQSGLTMGVALYEDLAVLRRMWAGDAADEENARITVATTVTFVEEWETSVADVEAARKYGWEVARPDAYPQAFHKDRGLSMRPPLPWELELLAASLRALPEFVKQRGQENPTPMTCEIPVGTAALSLTLSWTLDGPA